VRYPWGSSYSDGLQRALPKLGLATGADPLIEYSDNGGFLVGKTRRALARGQTIMLNMTGPEETDVVLARLRRLGVYEILQDWKHLEWHPDAYTLKSLGVDLRLVSTITAKEGERLTFEIQKRARPRAAKRAARAKRKRGPKR
jgi:hypothetical protein